jgi:hypothetical protein
VPVGDSAATVEAILVALGRSPDEEGARSARARQAVLERADARRNMEMMEKFYQDLVGPR